MKEGKRKIPAVIGLGIRYQDQPCVIVSADKTSVELRVKSRRVRIAFGTEVETESGISGKLSEYFSSDDALFFLFEDDMRLITKNILAERNEILTPLLSEILHDSVKQFRNIHKSVVHLSRSELRMAKKSSLNLYSRIPASLVSKSELIQMFDTAIVLGPKSMPLDHQAASLSRRSEIIEKGWSAFSFNVTQIEHLELLQMGPTDVAILIERGIAVEETIRWIEIQLLKSTADTEVARIASSNDIKKILRSPTFDPERFEQLWVTGWSLGDIQIVYEGAAQNKYLREWIHEFESASQISLWADAGFVRPEVAKQWHSHGIDASEASQWYALDFKNVDDALEWRSTGLSVYECRIFREAGVEEISEALSWMAFCNSTKNFQRIKVDFKLTIEDAQVATKTAGNVDALIKFLQYGVRIQQIIDWYSPELETISPDSRLNWILNGFDAKTAVLGERLGIPPELVHAMVKSRITFDDVIRWLETCGSVDLIKWAIKSFDETEIIEEWIKENLPIEMRIDFVSSSLTVSAFRKWTAIGINEPQLIRAWEISGIPLFIAKVWVKGGISNASVARRWSDNGFVAADALRAISLGFSLPSIVRQIADGAFGGNAVKTISALESLTKHDVRPDIINGWVNQGWRGDGIKHIEEVFKSDKLSRRWANSEIQLAGWWEWIPVFKGNAEAARAWNAFEYQTGEIVAFCAKYQLDPALVVEWEKEELTARDFVRATQSGITRPSEWKTHLRRNLTRKTQGQSGTGHAASDRHKVPSAYETWLKSVLDVLPPTTAYRRGFNPLLESAFEKNFKPSESADIKFKVDGDWFDEIAGRVALLKDLARKVPDWPTWYVSSQLVIGCIEDGGRVLAWVGIGQVGRVVMFDANSLASVTKIDSQYDLLVHGLAMSWYLDSSLLMDKNIETISLINGVYRPTRHFDSSVSWIRKNSNEIPRACEVSGHLRLLPMSMTPSHAQRALAPSYLQSRMKSQHTYVQPHSRNRDALKKELTVHLSKYSATASALALIGMKKAKS